MIKNNVTTKKCKQGKYKWVVHYPDGGTRKRKFFERKTGNDGAEAWASQKEQELAEIGSKQAAVSQEDQFAVNEWYEMMADLPEHAQNVSLRDCLVKSINDLQTRNKAKTCQEVADKLFARLLDKKKRVSPEWRKTLECRLKQFLAQYGAWLTCDISTEIIDEFLSDCLDEYARQTVLHRKQALNQLFNEAVKLKASPSNPVADAEDITINDSDSEVDDGEQGILTVEQTTALLANADEDTQAGLAISFFAGLRRSEIEKIDWKDIKLSNGYITISAAIAKTSQRRHVTISDNLMAWLKPYAKPNGKLIKSHAIWRSGMEKARANAGIEKWPKNAGRHSFASYHVYNPSNEKGRYETVKQLGHVDLKTLYKHYLTIVEPEDCVDYWNIYPPKAEDEKITRISA